MKRNFFIARTKAGGTVSYNSYYNSLYVKKYISEWILLISYTLY